MSCLLWRRGQTAPHRPTAGHHNLYFTGEVPAMTASVALPGGAVAAAARQVSGERSGDRTDREERLREQRIPVKEPAKGEPVMQRGRYLENQSSRSYATG